MAKQKIDPQNIDKLVEYVGGRDNIATVTHCITRLRFVLTTKAKSMPRRLKNCRW